MSIELIDLTKKYGDVTAVDNLSLTFPDKELAVLIGPSGCGKTTALRLINRLLEATSGDITFDGTSIREIPQIELRRSIGYVIQEIGLFPHMTVFQNIAVVPRLLQWDDNRITSRVKELLDLVNLEPSDYMEKYPAQLSGGQRQRVGVARGLGADPKILLMDEPFGAIDPINRETLQDSFLEIQREIQKTIVFVTHDIREAVKLGDRIAILRTGQLVQYDEVMQIINHPANSFVEDLMGSDRALKGLELLRVEDSYDPDYFALSLAEVKNVGDASRRVADSGQAFAFVIDESGRLQGYVHQHDLEEKDGSTLLVEVIKPAESVQTVSTLMEAITRMVTTGITSAAVVDKKQRILGVMRFRDVFPRVEELAGDPEQRR